MEYPKTNHLWLKKGHNLPDKLKAIIREENGGKLPFTQNYGEIDYGLVDIWNVEEKIDGTNIRLIIKEHKRGSCRASEKFKLTFEGRTKHSEIPPHLLEYLQDTFTIDKILDSIAGTWIMIESTLPMRSEITLFGEGYGDKIQGDYYQIGSPRFALFDILGTGRWAGRDKVREVAGRLGISTAPYIGEMDEQQIVAFVKSKPKSLINPEVTMEGIIARGEAYTKGDAPTFKANKKFKLRCEDF